ncbi:hypothetical protein PC116_g33594 [Phytophthora cactorum]|nr:hypothetical protein PC116_g33594 [Phytophthora cactorum]
MFQAKASLVDFLLKMRTLNSTKGDEDAGEDAGVDVGVDEDEGDK